MSPIEICRQLREIDVELRDLEAEGRDLETQIRSGTFTSILAHQGSLRLTTSVPALLYPWHIPLKYHLLMSAI